MTYINYYKQKEDLILSIKDFTELTREELIEQAADIFESNLSKHKRLMGLVDVGKNCAEKLLAVKIRKERFFEAEFDWKYYNEEDSVDLKWVEISKEKFRQRICNSLSIKTLDQLRLSYQVSIKDQYFVKENSNFKDKIVSAMDVVKQLDIEMTRRIDKVSEIPQETKFIGKIKDKLDAAFIEEHGINPNIAIWSRDNEFILLTVHSNEDESQIATVALKHHGDFYIFNEAEGENKEGFKALFLKLNEMLS